VRLSNRGAGENDLETGFRKGSRTRNQIVIICWIVLKTRDFQKIYY